MKTVSCIIPTKASLQKGYFRAFNTFRVEQRSSKEAENVEIVCMFSYYPENLSKEQDLFLK